MMKRYMVELIREDGRSQHLQTLHALLNPAIAHAKILQQHNKNLVRGFNVHEVDIRFTRCCHTEGDVDPRKGSRLEDESRSSAAGNGGTAAIQPDSTGTTGNADQVFADAVESR